MLSFTDDHTDEAKTKKCLQYQVSDLVQVIKQSLHLDPLISSVLIDNLYD